MVLYVFWQSNPPAVVKKCKFHHLTLAHDSDLERPWSHHSRRPVFAKRWLWSGNLEAPGAKFGLFIQPKTKTNTCHEAHLYQYHLFQSNNTGKICNNLQYLHLWKSTVPPSGSKNEPSMAQFGKSWRESWLTWSSLNPRHFTSHTLPLRNPTLVQVNRRWTGPVWGQTASLSDNLLWCPLVV